MLVENVINAASNLGAGEERSDSMYWDQNVEDLKAKLEKAKAELTDVLEAISSRELRGL